MTSTLTSTEVAALTGIDEFRVRKEVEHGLFGTETPPRFSEPALIYFRALTLLEIHLGRKDRSRLYHLIEEVSGGRNAPETVKLGPILELRLGDIVRHLRHLLPDFAAWKKHLTIDDKILGGETVFPGTRLAVRHVGALLERPGGLDEIREDYPALTERDLKYATLYAKAYPRRGRPPERREASSR